MRATARLLTTIPARLARPSKVSKNREEARARALSLYRSYYRSVPEIVALYALDVPPSTLRAKYRQRFEEYRHVDNLAVIDVLLHKGWVDYQETVNAFKQTSQLMKIFSEEETPPQPQTWLDKFFATKDEGRSVTGKGF